MDASEKSKFNNLASEYKEHLMREQPNFSYNKKQNNLVQQVPVNQSASTSNSPLNSAKSKSENYVPVIKVPSYESGNTKQLSDQQDEQGHIVQLQQRSGNEEGSKDTAVIHTNSIYISINPNYKINTVLLASKYFYGNIYILAIVEIARTSFIHQ